MPIYKSYGCPLILQYINYFLDCDIGFTFAFYEDIPKISFVLRLLKRIGALLIRRFPENLRQQEGLGTLQTDEINVINYVNQSLFEEIVENNPTTVLFQND